MRYHLFLWLLGLCFVFQCEESKTSLKKDSLDSLRRDRKVHETDEPIADFDILITKKVAEPMVVNEKAKELIARGERNMKDGDLDAATTDFNAAINEDENAYPAYNNLGIICDRKGLLGRAFNYYRKALLIKPEYELVRNILSIYIKKDAAEKGIALLRSLIQTYPENLYFKTLFYYVRLAQHQYGEVITNCREILKQDNKNTAAMTMMAYAYHYLKKYHFSLKICKIISDIDKGNAEAHHIAGYNYIELKDPKEAIKSFKRAVEIKKEFPEALLNLGALYYQNGDYPGAVEQLKEALKYNPVNKLIYVNLGNAYKGIKEAENAENSYNMARKIDPDYPETYFNLGILYLTLDRKGLKPIDKYKKAIDYFNRYKSLKRGILAPEDPVNRYLKQAEDRLIRLSKRKKG